MLLKGYGCSINKEKAIEYFKMAIEKDCLKAIYKYGLIMENEEYIKTAADKGYPKALYDYYLSLLKYNE